MSSHLSIVAGLGNPGERHECTLHNAGFWFADALAADAGGRFRFEKRFDADVCRVTIAGAAVRVVKPQAYMNRSGGPLRAVLDYYRLSVAEMLVAHDEIDLPPGTVRLKKGGGHGGHNGLRDVIRHCGADFMRLRLGVGHPGDRDRVTGYVLQRGGPDVERAIAGNIRQAVDVLPLLIERGLSDAMTRLHTRDDDAAAE